MGKQKKPVRKVKMPLIGDHTTSSKLYTVESIPEKGQGLVAAKDIPKDTRIIAEKPLFTVSSEVGSDQALANAIASRLHHLSEDEQRAFLSLRNNAPRVSNPLSGIFKTNALPLGPGSIEGGVFLQISRINHACLANCQHTWNETMGQETIHAVRCISKGEEITIMYIDGPSETRCRHLRNSFGFDCTCGLCSLPQVERATSDERLKEIQRLDQLIGDGFRFLLAPHKCLEDAYTLLTLLEAENIVDARLPRVYYDAFQIVIAGGDQARAKVFAEKAYEARLNCEGEDSPATALMKSFVKNPAKHSLFGMCSVMWTRPVEAIPRTMQEEQFRAWLWRRAK